MFKDWTTEKGGFVIKWINDESALVVFADPTVGELVVYFAVSSISYL